MDHPMSTKEREPYLSDTLRAAKAHQRACEMHGDPLGSGSDWMEYYKAHAGGSFDARTFYEAARAKDAELIQQLVNALKVERDDWHRLHDGNCETRRADDALDAAKAAGFTPSEP